MAGSLQPVNDEDAFEPVGGASSVYPRNFTAAQRLAGADVYLSTAAACKLAEFFESKGLARLKSEDRTELWYDDWLKYQAEHRIYASMLTPSAYGGTGSKFDLLNYARFLELFAYYSPAHGYSLQVSFLGFFSILMGTQSAIKREAVAILKAGGLLAFGVSERDHGADLLAGEFTVTSAGADRFVANGRKYYIGNANCAEMIAVLARKQQRGSAQRNRAPLVFVAVRPKLSKGFRSLRKIQTLGVRCAYVGEFELKDHDLPSSDLFADGRAAWDAVIGTVTLGKFFLGFGSIGICEHAFAEAVTYLQQRQLYGRAGTDMPHIAAMIALAWARLTAMKLYAYRALDYVHSASAQDRRYLLYCAIQKAKVSTEGVRVMALLSECIGAKGFEADTYFEMALRDAQLVPGLEGSTHINLAQTAQFIQKYFRSEEIPVSDPPSLVLGEIASNENEYLMQARAGSIDTVRFGPFLRSYRPLKSVSNVRRFAIEVRKFASFVRAYPMEEKRSDSRLVQSLGHCMSLIGYAQLIAENASRMRVASPVVAVIFHQLVSDFSAATLSLAAQPCFERAHRKSISRMVKIPQTSAAEWTYVVDCATGRRAP